MGFVARAAFVKIYSRKSGSLGMLKSVTRKRERGRLYGQLCFGDAGLNKVNSPLLFIPAGHLRTSIVLLTTHCESAAEFSLRSTSPPWHGAENTWKMLTWYLAS